MSDKRESIIGGQSENTHVEETIQTRVKTPNSWRYKKKRVWLALRYLCVEYNYIHTVLWARTTIFDEKITDQPRIYF